LFQTRWLLHLSIFCACCAVIVSSPTESLSATEPGIAQLAHAHPSTLWDVQEVVALKKSVKTNPGLRTAFDALQTWGNTRLSQPLGVPTHRLLPDGSWTFPEYKPGYKDTSGQWQWQWDFNTRLQQCSDDVSKLGMLYALTGNPKYADFAGQILLALTDAYGYDKGSFVPDPNGYDHFQAYGFDGGDDGLFLAKACNGYDLIRNSLSSENRFSIESGLIRPLAVHLEANDWMYTNQSRWALVCLYGVLIGGTTLNDRDMEDLALYGKGGTKDNVTGGFMDCFKQSPPHPGSLWPADTKIEDQMASVCVMTSVAEVMRHNGVDLYEYQDRALKLSFDAALAWANSNGASNLLALRGIDAFQYAYVRYHDAKYLEVVNQLKPSFALTLGEQLPPLPTLAEKGG